MLRVQLGSLEHRPAEVSGAIAPDDPLFEGLDFELGAPVSVTGRISSASVGQYYWRGAIVTTANAACCRCLAQTSCAIEARVDVIFTQDQDAVDPSEYVLSEGTHVLELHDAVREELILAMPEFVLCREDCKGLCPTCGTDLNAGSCECRPATDSRWEALEELKTRLDG